MQIISSDSKAYFSRGIEWEPQYINGMEIPFDEHAVCMACFFEYEKMLDRGAKLDSKLEEWKKLVSCYWPDCFYHTNYTDMMFDTIIMAETLVCLIGAAGAGKSAIGAIWCLLNFDYYRKAYACSIFSMNEEKLRTTAWKELSKFYYASSRPIYGCMIPSYMHISSSTENSSLGVKCRTIKPSVDPIQEVTSQAGMHGVKKHDVIFEEANTVRDSVYGSLLNIMTGTKASKVICVANPVNVEGTTFSRTHEPEFGYKSVDIMRGNMHEYGSENSTRWRLRKGYALRIDGRDSPGLQDPIKYEYNLTQETIDHHEAFRHITPVVGKYYNIIMGWVDLSEEETGWSVLTREEIEMSRIKSPADFSDINSCKWLFSLDMSYEGNDLRRMVALRHGKEDSVEGPVDVMEIAQFYTIQSIEKNRIGYYKEVAAKVSKIMKAHGAIRPEQMSIDVTAGGNTFAERIAEEMNWGNLPYCVSWRTLAPEKHRRLSKSDPTDSKEICADRPTEMYMLFQEFAKRGQIRSVNDRVPEKLLEEAKARKFLMEGRNGKRAIEPKEITKKRLPNGRSPDDLDAMAQACTHLRDIYGILPSRAGEKVRRGPNAGRAKRAETVKSMLDKIKPRVKSY